MKRLLAAMAVVLLTACSPNYPAGPTGIVTDRSATYRSKAGGWFYYLTVDGKEFRVTRDEYKHCFHASHYPACTKRGDS